jgi:RHS repeat-associated protein
METDDEVVGTGNSYTTDYRQYDPRLGRWLSIDPLFRNFPWQSPYAYYANSPIWQIDYLGMGKLTRYVGEDGKELANTKDGNNSTITVTNDKRVEFDKWKTESEANGTLNNAENNMDMIHSLTPSHKGVYFTNSSFGLKYMTRFSTLENKEYSGYLLKNGLYVDAVEGYDIRIKDYEQNDHSTSGTYTRIVKTGLELSVILMVRLKPHHLEGITKRSKGYILDTKLALKNST